MIRFSTPKHLFLSLAVLFATSSALFGQDVHFSQFYMSPLNLNPALTGVMNCNTRITANYRNQWASILRSKAFSTYSVSYDRRMTVGRYDYFGVGGTLLGDVAGTSRFQTIQGRVSASYSKRMGGYKRKNHYLVMGAELGASQRSIDFLALRWGTQHDGNGGVDPNLPTFENFNRDNFLFLDLSAGLMWFTTFNSNSNFFIGGAYHHLNRANQSFSTDAKIDPLYSKFTIHAGGEAMFTNRVGVVPGIVTFIQGPSTMINGGTSLKFVLDETRNEYQAFLVGMWARLSNRYDKGLLTDAVILSTRFDYNDFSIGFSYDLNVSNLSRASNGNGAYEFSLVYKLCGPERRNVYCPRF